LTLGVIAMIALMIYGADNPTAEVLRYWGEQRAVLKHDRSAPLKPQTEYLIIFPFWVLNLVIGTILVIIYAGATLLQGAVTRPREYMADAGALELIKDPQPLVSALRRISSQQSNDPVPAAFLATLISGPSIGWLATHPNVEDRVTALRTFGTGRDVEDAVPRRAEGVAPLENPGAAARPARSARIVQGLSSLPPSLTRG
jgi:Zn-dependent protease with chaperone function